MLNVVLNQNQMNLVTLIKKLIPWGKQDTKRHVKLLTDRQFIVIPKQYEAGVSSVPESLYPVMSATMSRQGAFDTWQLDCFAQDLQALNPNQFCRVSQLMLAQLGYHVRPHPHRPYDLLARYGSSNILVRTLFNPETINDFDLAVSGLDEVKTLAQDKYLIGADAAILISAGKQSEESYLFNRNNRIFGLAAYDLMGLLNITNLHFHAHCNNSKQYNSHSQNVAQGQFDA